MLKRVTNGVAEDGWGNTRQPLGDAIDAPVRYRLFKKTIINHELAHHSFILIIYYFYYLSLITYHLLLITYHSSLTNGVAHTML